VQVAGEVSELLATHRRISGPRRDPATLPASQEVIQASHTDKRSVLLVRAEEPVHDRGWSATGCGHG
jgi:ABC-2 type transport system ATP-binding protein